MSKRIGVIWNYLAHYKYLITIVLGVLWVGFIDDNSIHQHLKYQWEIDDLRSEIEKYNDQNVADMKMLKEMRAGSKAYEKIARERYFMKADDEDIFVLSTDLPEETTEEDNSSNETVE